MCIDKNNTTEINTAPAGRLGSTWCLIPRNPLIAHHGLTRGNRKAGGRGA